MITVELLKDVAEGGIEWKEDAPRDAMGRRPNIKTMRVKNPKYVPPGENTEYTMDGANPKYVPPGENPEYITVELRAGTVLTMHEASAEKWVSRGLCKEI